MKNLKKNGKRFFALFLSLVMALGIMQTTAFAARDYVVPVYAVGVDSNNKIVSVSPAGFTNKGKTTSQESTTTGGVTNRTWNWTPDGDGYYTMTAHASTNVNVFPYVKWPGDLWNIPSGYTYKGYNKLTSAPYVGGSMGSVVGPGYSWNYGKGNYTIQVTNATGTYLAYYFSVPAPTPVTYTLNYNANGGTGAPASQSASSTAGSYTFTISSQVPTKSGSTFKGWSTSSSATTASYQPGNTINVTGTTTLYAVWEAAPAKEAEKSGTAELQILKTFEGADKPSTFYMTYSITNTAVGGNQGKGTLLFTEMVPGIYSATVKYPTWTFTGSWTATEKAGYDSVITLTEKGADIANMDLTITADGATVSGNTITYKVGAQATGGDMLEVINSYTDNTPPTPELTTSLDKSAEKLVGDTWVPVAPNEAVPVGTRLKYTIVVENTSEVDFEDLTIFDDMNSGLVLDQTAGTSTRVVKYNGNTTEIEGYEVAAEPGENTYQMWTVTDGFPAGAVAELTYQVTVQAHQDTPTTNSVLVTPNAAQSVGVYSGRFAIRPNVVTNEFTNTITHSIITRNPAVEESGDRQSDVGEAADEVSGIAQ